MYVCVQCGSCYALPHLYGDYAAILGSAARWVACSAAGCCAMAACLAALGWNSWATASASGMALHHQIPLLLLLRLNNAPFPDLTATVVQRYHDS